MPVKVREVIRRLRHEGWYVARRGPGDHQQWKNDAYPERRVTLDGKPNDDIKPGTWNEIQKQAGWKP